MAEYKPEYRRPIANAFRRTAHWAVRLCVKANIHPDVVSYMSILSAAAAGVCFWQASKAPWLLLLGPAFCYLRLWCNMLDGMVALASGKASPRGEILNELPDRISDIIVFVSLAYSGLCCESLGFWAAIMALMTAYVGTLGQATGVQRDYSGVMSKPWRMVAVHIGTWTAFVLIQCKLKLPGSLSALDWTCVVVIAGCVQTVAIRLARILTALAKGKAA